MRKPFYDRGLALPKNEAGPARVIGLVMALFFAFGFCTVLVDSIIPKLKATFALSYAEVMLTQFCFFGAYFLVSLPAAWLHSRIGYLQGVAVGLLLMALGCLLFTPAADAGVYPGFCWRCSFWLPALPSCRSPPIRSRRAPATQSARPAV